MKLAFSKMHGLGNDFVVIDAIHQSVNLSGAQIRTIADRHFGIGCDQLLLVERSDDERADFRYRIFNADGSEVEQCGNGARCFAVFVREQGLSDKTEIPVITQAGVIHLNVESDGEITVDMGIPDFRPSSLPMATEQKPLYSLGVGDELVNFGAVSMGNPHAVIRVEDVISAPVEELGPLLQCHDLFTRSVNVGFMQVIDRGEIKLRVYERGAGETLACGTGACAAVVIGHQQGWLDERVVVNLTGGKLSIYWAGEGNPVMMKGPAKTVFTGEITL